MNNPRDIKIVYKKPNEYDNATLSMYSNNTNDTNNLENNESVQNIQNKLNSDNNYSENEIELIVLNIKKNIQDLKKKEDIIQYIDNFFELNSFCEDIKNKILIKLNKIIIEQNNNIDNNKNIDNKNIDNKNIENNNNINNQNEEYIEIKHDSIMGLKINYWFSISLVIIFLLFIVKRK